MGGELLAVDDERHVGAFRGIQEDAEVSPYVGGRGVVQGVVRHNLDPAHDDERAILHQVERLEDASLHEQQPTTGGIWWEDMH